jgi:hypothetical protein
MIIQRQFCLAEALAVDNDVIRFQPHFACLRGAL